LNANGTVRSAGQASARLSGYGPEEQIGHSAFEHLHADDVAAAHAMFAECLTHTGVPTTGELRADAGRNLGDDRSHSGQSTTSAVASSAGRWRGACISALFQEASMKLIGVLLIVLGLVALAVGGFSYTKQEKILDIGPIHATNEEHKTIPISPITGVVAVAAGIALVVVDTRKRVL